MSETIYALPVDPEVPPSPAEVVNRLVAAEMPIGLTRVFVELVGDGLAMGVRVPTLVMRGKHPGPIFGLTACMHGNELNGIPVIHDLMRSFDAETLHGTVVGVVALNVLGLLRHQREFADGTDLNRIMPGDPNGNVAQVYAHRILERIVNQFDLLVDLHTASFGRANSLYVRADMTDPRTASMAYLQWPEIIVHNEASDHTLRGAAMQLGIPSITVEIGDPQRWQEKYTSTAIAGVAGVLAWAGLTKEGAEERPVPTESVLCRASSWMYTDRGGLLEVYPNLRDRVSKGDLVGSVHNAFGDVIREYRASRDGIVVGKSTNPVGQTGARIVHLGRLAGPDAGLLRREDCPRSLEEANRNF